VSRSRRRDADGPERGREKPGRKGTGEGEVVRARLWPDDRGVSETIGFVLVFALITTTIAVTFTVGLGGLEDAQLAERDTNVERAFDVLQDNLNDIARDGVPSRSTEIGLGGGRLAFEDRTQVTINSTAWTDSYTRNTSAIVYRGADDTRIVYENGAVFRTQKEGGVMLSEPDLLVGDTVVYSLIGVSAADSRRTVGGDRTVLLVGSRSSRGPVDRPRTPSENVTVTVDSPRAGVWARYYADLADEEDGLEVETSGDTVVTVTVVAGEFDRFVVHETDVDVAVSE
jgi:hypothetical protein